MVSMEACICLRDHHILHSSLLGVSNNVLLASYLPAWIERECENWSHQRRTRRPARTVPHTPTTSDSTAHPHILFRMLSGWTISSFFISNRQAI
jgi:hypothetical protein